MLGSAASTTARAVDAGRLAGLAEGDGVGPRAATSTTRSRAPGSRSTATRRRSPSSTRVPLRRARPRSSTPGGPPSRLPGRPRCARRGSRAPCCDRWSGSRGRPARSREPVGSGDGLGSNGWVVAGSHTTTGKPLLANDPHLDVRRAGRLVPDGPALPDRRRRLPVRRSGVQLAGFPGVVIGHNHDIAWGMTNLEPDVTDLYLEKVTGKDYLLRRQAAPAGGARRGDPDRRR